MSYTSGRNDGIRIFAVIATVIVVVVAITLIGWQVGWWFTTQNTIRSSHLYEHEYGHQSSLLDDFASKQETLDEITVELSYPGADVTALKTQRLGVATILCQDSAKLNGNLDGLNPSQKKFVNDNCDGAAVKPTSSLRP